VKMVKSFFDVEPSSGEGERNIISEYFAQLENRNYIAKAEPQDGKYWFNFYENKLIEKYISPYNKDFSLIIRGSDSMRMDFFAIPYPALEHVLTPEFIHVEKKENKRRWMFDIIPDHVLVIESYYLDVSSYYGNLSYVPGLPEGVK